MPQDYYAVLVQPCSQAEAEAGTDNAKPMTPLRAYQANADLRDRTKVIGSGLPMPLQDVVVTALTVATDPRALDYFGGYLWGATTAGHIYRSSDMWATKTLIQNSAISGITRMLACDDGEILVSNGANVYKSSGWYADPTTATFAIKATANTNCSILQWGIDGDGTKFITTEYAADVNFAFSRYVRLSLDGGDTWNVVYDTDAEHGSTANGLSHLHACCYDSIADRFWIVEGHSEDDPSSGIGGLYFSDDDGVTWTHNTSTAVHHNGGYSTLTATDYGLVCGTDQNKNGIWIFPRTETPATTSPYLAWEWHGETAFTGNNGFATRAYKDPTTGLVYVGFSSGQSGVKCVIAASDGRSAGLLHSVASTGTPGDEVSQTVVANGVLVSHYTDTGNTVNKQLRGTVVDGLRTANTDTSNLLAASNCASNSIVVGATANGGNAVTSVLIGQLGTLSATENSIAIGYAASASAARCIVIGASGSVAVTDSTVVGYGATSGNAFSTAIGSTAAVTGDNGIAIGRLSASAGGVSIGNSSSGLAPSSTSVGESAASSTSSVSVGNGATTDTFGVAVGQSSSAVAAGTAVGWDADANASYAICIGPQATSSFQHTFVVGYQTAATAANQMQIKDKHIEGKEVAAPGAGGADTFRLYAEDNGSGKTRLMVIFQSGAAQQIAIEP